jgi:hypothetical protein
MDTFQLALPVGVECDTCGELLVIERIREGVMIEAKDGRQSRRSAAMVQVKPHQCAGNKRTPPD